VVASAQVNDCPASSWSDQKLFLAYNLDTRVAVGSLCDDVSPTNISNGTERLARSTRVVRVCVSDQTLKTEMIAIMRLTSIANVAMETLIASSSWGSQKHMTPRYQTGAGALDLGC
jgi:hypothetical protein